MFWRKEKQRLAREAERQADVFDEWIEMVIAREFSSEQYARDWSMRLAAEIKTTARSAIYKAAGNTAE